MLRSFVYFHAIKNIIDPMYTIRNFFYLICPVILDKSYCSLTFTLSCVKLVFRFVDLNILKYREIHTYEYDTYMNTLDKYI